MKELLAQAKVHLSRGDSSLRWPKDTLSVDTLYGEYGVDVYHPLEASSNPPLVVELGLGRRKDSLLAKRMLENIVDPSRSTFVFQAARQSNNIETSVSGQLTAMHKVGIDEYDSIGMSFGGFETLAKARRAGSRALHVVTFAAVGELAGGSLAYGRAIPGLLRSAKVESHRDMFEKAERIARSLGENGIWLAGCVGHPHNTIAQLAIICQADLMRIVNELPMSTHLTMVVGELDSVAGLNGADAATEMHRSRAGSGMAQRVLVRNISHSLTSEVETVAYITKAVLRGDSLSDEIDLVRPARPVRRARYTTESAVERFHGDTGLALAG